MASKHDAKRARANFWVTQQNLAKQKGGRAGFTFKEKRAPVAKTGKAAEIPTRAALPSTEPTTGAADANAVEETVGTSTAKNEQP